MKISNSLCGSSLYILLIGYRLSDWVQGSLEVPLDLFPKVSQEMSLECVGINFPRSWWTRTYRSFRALCALMVSTCLDHKYSSIYNSTRDGIYNAGWLCCLLDCFSEINSLIKKILLLNFISWAQHVSFFRQALSSNIHSIPLSVYMSHMLTYGYAITWPLLNLSQIKYHCTGMSCNDTLQCTTSQTQTQTWLLMSANDRISPLQYATVCQNLC